MKVLGVDPGTAATGFGVVEADGRRAPRLIECGVIRPTPRSPLADRLRQVHQEVTALLDRHGPDVLAVEEAFHGRNARTTLVLGHARGVILLAGAQAGVLVAEYSPAVIKKTITGRGAAMKPQVGVMVARLLRLSAPPAPSDAADGVAVALTHLLSGARPSLTRRPA